MNAGYLHTDLVSAWSIGRPSTWETVERPGPGMLLCVLQEVYSLHTTSSTGSLNLAEMLVKEDRRRLYSTCRRIGHLDRVDSFSRYWIRLRWFFFPTWTRANHQTFLIILVAQLEMEHCTFWLSTGTSEAVNYLLQS